MFADWRAACTSVGYKGGTDVMTGFCRYMYGDGELKEAVEKGAVVIDEVDAMVARVLRLYARVLPDNERKAVENYLKKKYTLK